MASLNSAIVQIRQRLCKYCKDQCSEYKAGQIEHGNPCVACPIRKWHAFEDADCPKEAVPVVDDRVVEMHPGSPHLSKEPGSLLKWMIWKVTGTLPCSQCDARAKQMNEWGWIGCIENRETIAEWMIQEAKARGHEISRLKTLSLMLAAIRELRAKE